MFGFDPCMIVSGNGLSSVSCGGAALAGFFTRLSTAKKNITSINIHFVLFLRLTNGLRKVTNLWERNLT